MSAAAIRLQLRERMPAVARGRTAKTLARIAEVSTRSAEKWRAGSLPSVPAFIALAREIPELRALVLRWLDAERDHDPELGRLSLDVMRAVERYEEARMRRVVTREGAGDDR